MRSKTLTFDPEQTFTLYRRGYLLSEKLKSIVDPRFYSEPSGREYYSIQFLELDPDLSVQKVNISFPVNAWYYRSSALPNSLFEDPSDMINASVLAIMKPEIDIKDPIFGIHGIDTIIKVQDYIYLN